MTAALCQQQRIGGGRCTNRSAYRFTWPGRPESTICATCQHKLRNVAAAMGFDLELVPYEEPRRDTQPAPPLNEAEDDPPWMRDTAPGRDSVGDIVVSSSNTDPPAACATCGGVDGQHSLLCASGWGRP